MYIVLLKCPHVQNAFLKFTSSDNQALVGCIPIAAVRCWVTWCFLSQPLMLRPQHCNPLFLAYLTLSDCQGFHNSSKISLTIWLLFYNQQHFYLFGSFNVPKYYKTFDSPLCVGCQAVHKSLNIKSFKDSVSVLF